MEEIRAGSKDTGIATTSAIAENTLAEEVAHVYLEVGVISSFFWDELSNPRVQRQHEFENDDEVVFIISIVSPVAIGTDIISGYDYSIVDAEKQHRHDWSAGIDPDWNSSWIVIAAEFNEYGTPTKGNIAGDYFGSNQRILYAHINELDVVSEPYVITVTECEEGTEEITEFCEDDTKKKWCVCENGEWVYYERTCPAEEEVEEAKIQCPIACVCMGTNLIDELGPLREFRDGILKRTSMGRKLIGFYYGNLNKYLTPILNKHNVLKRIGRNVIRLLVK